MRVAVDFESELERWEEHCREYMRVLRWPDGVTCPRCGSGDTAPLGTRLFACAASRYRFSVTTGTALHNSRVPLWKWLVAVGLLVDAGGDMPVNELAKHVGGSTRTATSIGRRVRPALAAAAELGGPCVRETLRALLRPAPA